MDLTNDSSDSIQEQSSAASSLGRTSQPQIDRLAMPLTVNERAESRRQLIQLHPGNRFRLLAGMPLLPDEPENGSSH
jgi:hypothetical protein